MHMEVEGEDLHVHMEVEGEDLHVHMEVEGEDLHVHMEVEGEDLHMHMEVEGSLGHASEHAISALLHCYVDEAYIKNFCASISSLFFSSLVLSTPFILFCMHKLGLYLNSKHCIAIAS